MSKYLIDLPLPPFEEGVTGNGNRVETYQNHTDSCEQHYSTDPKRFRVLHEGISNLLLTEAVRSQPCPFDSRWQAAMIVSGLTYLVWQKTIRVESIQPYIVFRTMDPRHFELEFGRALWELVRQAIEETPAKEQLNRYLQDYFVIWFSPFIKQDVTWAPAVWTNLFIDMRADQHKLGYDPLFPLERQTSLICYLRMPVYKRSSGIQHLSPDEQAVIRQMLVGIKKCRREIVKHLCQQHRI